MPYNIGLLLWQNVLSYFYLHSCSLGFEPLGDEGVCSIASALKENSTLIDLSYVKYIYTLYRL